MTTIVNKTEITQPNAGMEMIRIIATLMLFGGIGVGAWVMSQQGYADKAGTILSAAIVFVITRAWSRGMVGLPKTGAGASRLSEDEDFLKANARAATNVAVARMNAASMASLSAMGLAYGVGFLALREGITRALTVFQNVWICVTVGLIIGSVVAMPGLIKNLIKPFRKDGAADAVVQVQQVPTAPPAPTPVQQPTTAQPAQAPAPAKRVVVKRVVRKTEGEQA
ncbi:hypothetical protein K8O93_18720 [Gordonia bronchialis]|uniref:hypothetical protein n=1 Tax=Gordonia bronchialis TaxID=2054 RepID=UPI001CC1B1AF|nr:hypothetical protein [Gordonia bronchialis]UAK37180.1 hypothetical protein K8O93_18720 [Gordonia bronchialis]